MFVSSKRLKASFNFIQQDISYIFQKPDYGKCNLFNCRQAMTRLNERGVTEYAEICPTFGSS